ncbi:unnamed protein product, partial [Amoebophrya sp. A25]
VETAIVKHYGKGLHKELVGLRDVLRSRAGLLNMRALLRSYERRPDPLRPSKEQLLLWEAHVHVGVQCEAVESQKYFAGRGHYVLPRLHQISLEQRKALGNFDFFEKNPRALKAALIIPSDLAGVLARFEASTRNTDHGGAANSHQRAMLLGARTVPAPALPAV